MATAAAAEHQVRQLLNSPQKILQACRVPHTQAYLYEIQSMTLQSSFDRLYLIDAICGIHACLPDGDFCVVWAQNATRQFTVSAT